MKNSNELIKFIVDIDDLPTLENNYKEDIYQAIIELLNRAVYDVEYVSLNVSPSLVKDLYKSLGFIIGFINKHIDIDEYYEFTECETLTSYSVILTLDKREFKNLYPNNDNNLLKCHPSGLGKHMGVFGIVNIKTENLEKIILDYYNSDYLPLIIEDGDGSYIGCKYLMVVDSDIHNKSFDPIPSLIDIEIIMSNINYAIKEVLRYLKFSEYVTISFIGLPDSSNK